MSYENLIRALWRAVAAQGDAGAMADFFTEDAVVLWPNTDERFTLAEYLRANCAYPGQWKGEVEKSATDGSFSVARVWDGDSVFRAVSFYRWQGEKICRMVEYWSDVAPAPRWRREMGIGCSVFSAQSD